MRAPKVVFFVALRASEISSATAHFAKLGARTTKLAAGSKAPPLQRAHVSQKGHSNARFRMRVCFCMGRPIGSRQGCWALGVSRAQSSRKTGGTKPDEPEKPRVSSQNSTKGSGPGKSEADQEAAGKPLAKETTREMTR